MTITWDAQADAKILAGFIAYTNSGAINYQGIAEFVGDGCTVSALKHRIQRIKDKAGITSPPKPAAGTDLPKAPAPSKGKRSTQMKATKGNSKRKPNASKNKEANAEQTEENQIA